MTRCPECESDLELDGYELDVGETINCPECSVELRVTSVDPIGVALADDEAVGLAVEASGRDADGLRLVVVDLEGRQQPRHVERAVDALADVQQLELGLEAPRGLEPRHQLADARRCRGRRPPTG